MKRKTFWIALLLVLVIAVPVFAGETRAVRIYPLLTFSGTTANCTVSSVMDHSSDRYSAVIKLWNDDACIRTWSSFGQGVLDFNSSAPVIKGKAYKLTADVTINGRLYQASTPSKVCPR